MIQQSVHISIPTKKNDVHLLGKHLWIALLHVDRIPPHVGLIVKGSYNSLTLKGHELDIDLAVLLKTISLKKIESVFIKVVPHPVFSIDYQLQILREYIKQFQKVEPNEATCLSPIKLFFQEFYALQLNENELLYDFIERLNANNYLEYAQSLNFNLPLNVIELPFYTSEQLQEIIIKEHLPYSND
ncbi:MAG: hypothetical protein SFY56_10360 [Bacteroidota bacterium]|nr:hypothetical protein [Bacteroidota bacterium]